MDSIVKVKIQRFSFGFQSYFLCNVFVAIFCSSSAFSEMLKLPAVGTWNGFFEHRNIVECSNLSGTPFIGNMEVKDQQGTVLSSVPLQIAPNGSSHIPLESELVSDRYGTYEINRGGDFFIDQTVESENSVQLICTTMIYRFTEAGKVDYVFAVPVESTLKGDTFGIFNSINPEGSLMPVLNWLSIYNPGQLPFSGFIEVYDQNGQLDTLRGVRIQNLLPGERVDYPLAHVQGQLTGLYRIRPDDTAAQYGAILTRYSQKDKLRFNFAFPLFPLTGSCNVEPVYISTMDPATNWLEIANPSAHSVKALIELRDQAGKERSLTRVIEPFSQTHIYVNQFLGERNLGSATVSCLEYGPDAKLIVQSLYYGHSERGSEVIWAYASQAGDTSNQIITANFAQINTNLAAPNWAAFLNDTEDPKRLTYVYHTLEGLRLSSRQGTVLGRSTLTHDIHSAVGYSFVGRFLSFSLDNLSRISAEAIRVYPNSDGTLGYVAKVPVTSLALEHEPNTAYFLVSVDNENFVIALKDQSLIDHARRLLHNASIRERGVMGRIVKSRAAYNPEWSFHLAQESIQFFDAAPEICDSGPSLVESGEHTYEVFCPWLSEVVAEINF